MRAEREKRADILESDGFKQAQINESKGAREESINFSKGERQKRINEADGEARAIEIQADATAEGIKLIAEALSRPNGDKARKIRIINQYTKQLGKIIDTAETQVIPLEAAQVKSLLQTVIPAVAGKGGK